MNSAGWSHGPPMKTLSVLHHMHGARPAATYFTCAVKSDVVHLIMVCWVFLLQSFGAEQIGHTRWPTNIFAHACVEVKPISIPFSCIPSRNKAEIGATSFASLKYSAFMQLTMVHCCGGFGDEQCWVVPWTTNENFVCITSHARSTPSCHIFHLCGEI